MASYGGQASDGMRAARHAKARQIEIEDSELKKRKLADSLKVSNIENKFSAHYDAVEQQIKASTVRSSGRCVYPPINCIARLDWSPLTR